MMRKVISLFDHTCLMVKPWLDDGYQCFCFDGKHDKGVTVEGNLVKVGMWFDPYKLKEHVGDIRATVGEGVALVIGFPECTDLAVSGSRWFKDKAALNPAFQKEATNLATLAELVADSYSAPYMIENPVSKLSTLWRKPNYSFHPYEYGGYLSSDDIHPIYPEYIKAQDAYPKKTCIWGGNGFVMPERKPVAVDEGYSLQHLKLGGKSDKTKAIRSCSPRGYALAVWEANREG